MERERNAEANRKHAEELEKIESKDELCRVLSEEVLRIETNIEALNVEHTQEITDFNRRLAESKLELESSRIAAQSYQRQLEEMKADNYYLRVLNDSLRMSLRSRDDEQESIPIPDSYDQMEQWASQHLSGRLVLHTRATHALSDAVYEDVKLVYEALLLLATSFHDMKTGVIKTEQWEVQRAQLGLRFSGSISTLELGKFKDEYYVTYPLHTEHKRVAEYHLRKGKTRDKRRCLAIYFFWDEETDRRRLAAEPSGE